MGCFPSNLKTKEKGKMSFKRKSLNTFNLSMYKSINKTNKNDFLSINQSKNLINKLSQNKWTNIMDFLTYNELKETGKVCKYFHNICIKKEILTKFFKKREINCYLVFNYETYSTNVTSHNTSPKYNVNYLSHNTCWSTKKSIQNVNDTVFVFKNSSISIQPQKNMISFSLLRNNSENSLNNSTCINFLELNRNSQQ